MKGCPLTIIEILVLVAMLFCLVMLILTMTIGIEVVPESDIRSGTNLPETCYTGTERGEYGRAGEAEGLPDQAEPRRDGLSRRVRRVRSEVICRGEANQLHGLAFDRCEAPASRLCEAMVTEGVRMNERCIQV